MCDTNFRMYGAGDKMYGAGKKMYGADGTSARCGHGRLCYNMGKLVDRYRKCRI